MDLIDRKCVSAWLHEMGYTYAAKVIMDKKRFPSELRWIPCKDRMPDKDGDYIVSGKWEDGEISVGECDYSIEDGYFNASWRFTVLAWMKKPEPYQEGE